MVQCYSRLKNCLLKDTYVLIPGTYECYFIWCMHNTLTYTQRRGDVLCRYDSIKGLEISRLSWVVWLGIQRQSYVPHKREAEVRFQTHRRRLVTKEVVMHWSDAATNQGMPGATRKQQKKQGAHSPWEPPEGPQAASILISTQWNCFGLLASRIVTE